MTNRQNLIFDGLFNRASVLLKRQQVFGVKSEVDELLRTRTPMKKLQGYDDISIAPCSSRSFKKRDYKVEVIKEMRPRF